MFIPEQVQRIFIIIKKFKKKIIKKKKKTHQ